MRYEVTGTVPRKNNRKGRLTVEADSTEEAVAKARKRGLVVETVNPVESEVDSVEADHQADVSPEPEGPSEPENPWDAVSAIDEDETVVDSVPRRRTSPYTRPLRGSHSTRNSRFWLLNFLVSTGYLLALILFGLSVAVAVLTMFLPVFEGESLRLWESISIPISTALTLLPFLVGIQLIDCFLAIEENTQKASAVATSRGISFGDLSE